MARSKDFESLVRDEEVEDWDDEYVSPFEETRQKSRNLAREMIGWRPVAPQRLNVALQGQHPEFRRFEDAWQSQTPINILGLQFHLRDLRIECPIGSIVEATFTLRSVGRDLTEMG